ncbi:hypothetical protein KS4_32770 [Poriferisphaera corsica]|uniref:Uncharacterized protein n=1 Tax=Poriferisphaera corsica TaxID=2528020 RepID=A0A517YYB8_9BACT|nr:hypothetical protein KS4_32770 [Poriferisphaera corsica]
MSVPAGMKKAEVINIYYGEITGMLVSGFRSGHERAENNFSC